EPELHNDLLADQIEDQTHASTQGDPSPSTALLPTSPPVTHGPSGDPAGYGVPRSSAPISSNPSTSDVRNATVLDTSSWAVRYELSNATGQNIKGCFRCWNHYPTGCSDHYLRPIGYSLSNATGQNIQGCFRCWNHYPTGCSDHYLRPIGYSYRYPAQLQPVTRYTSEFTTSESAQFRTSMQRS
ncbi:hypothetical protein WG66_008956, partial [Moniliophthora roreri]